MTIGSGIAVASIWIAVAVIGSIKPETVMVSGIFAMIATMAVASK